MKIRAAKHGRSMEEEAREILKIGVATSESGPNMYESIRALFGPLGRVELPEYPRGANVRGMVGTHILTFDETAPFAQISAGRRGRPIGKLDPQIDAIAPSHGATVATQRAGFCLLRY